jgi:phosphoglycolate phosphatase
MIKAVIIDFDDTLCLTELACFNLENAALELLGRSPQRRKVHRETWGQPLYDAIRARSPGINVHEFRVVVEEMRQLWVVENKIDAVPAESLRTLDNLLNQGKELYILTSRTRDEVKHLTASDHELASRIKAFYYRDVMTYIKPDPRAFNQLLDHHNLERDECVYVGDSPTDAAAAKRGGLHFIATLESGLRTERDFSDYPVDLFVHKFTEVETAVRKLDAALMEKTVERN